MYAYRDPCVRIKLLYTYLQFDFTVYLKFLKIFMKFQSQILLFWRKIQFIPVEIAVVETVVEVVAVVEIDLLEVDVADIDLD